MLSAANVALESKGLCCEISITAGCSCIIKLEASRLIGLSSPYSGNASNRLSSYYGMDEEEGIVYEANIVNYGWLL